MSVLNVAGENETLIGDVKISFGGQSDKWLPCDGSVISRENYPELAKALNEKFSYQTTADYLNPDFSNSYDINPIGVYRASGITIVVNQPQRYVSTSTSYYYIYRPVGIHVKNDKDKDWTHLSVEGHDNFIANGYCYNSSQRRHYIFGDVKVSDTEYHPAIIHAYYNAVTSAWTFTQLSTTENCRLWSACNIGSTQHFFGRATDYSSTYCFRGTSYSNIAEVQLGSGAPSSLNNAFSGDNKVFCNSSNTLYYAADVTQPFTAVSMPTSGSMCYANGTMVLCHLINYSATFYYSDDYASGVFQRAALPDGFKFSDWSIKQVVYVNGAFVAEIRRVPGGTRVLLVSTDRGRTWQERACQNGLYPTDFYVYGSSLYFAEMYTGFYEWSHLEADAVLPLIKPERGTAYIKGK